VFTFAHLKKKIEHHVHEHTQVGHQKETQRHHPMRGHQHQDVHSMVRIQKRNQEQSIPCSLCQIITKYVEHYVQENATEQVIIQRLKTFCSDIGPLQPECQSFVATYAPRLINWIVSKENPNVFCSQIHVCTGADLIPNLKNLMKLYKFTQSLGIKKREESQTICQVCQLVVTYVEDWVVQNKTLTEIEKEVEEVCTIAPPPIQGYCVQVVEGYLPSMVDWLVKKENPNVFCSQTSLC